MKKCFIRNFILIIVLSVPILSASHPISKISHIDMDDKQSCLFQDQLNYLQDFIHSPKSMLINSPRDAFSLLKKKFSVEITNLAESYEEKKPVYAYLLYTWDLILHAYSETEDRETYIKNVNLKLQPLKNKLLTTTPVSGKKKRRGKKKSKKTKTSLNKKKFRFLTNKNKSIALNFIKGTRSQMHLSLYDSEAYGNKDFLENILYWFDCLMDTESQIALANIIMHQRLSSMVQNNLLNLEESDIKDNFEVLSWWANLFISYHTQDTTECINQYCEKGLESYNDYKRLFYFKLAAAQGHVEALFNLGSMYHNNQGVDQDYQKAFYYYKRAANQGHARSQCRLGCMYNNGQGVDQDYQMAQHYFKLATNKDYVGTLFNLGSMYHNNQGVDQDYQKALYYYKLAADQGHARSQCRLACMYNNGQGVDQDYQKAQHYFKLATNQDYVETQNLLDKMPTNAQSPITTNSHIEKEVSLKSCPNIEGDKPFSEQVSMSQQRDDKSDTTFIKKKKKGKIPSLKKQRRKTSRPKRKSPSSPETGLRGQHIKKTLKTLKRTDSHGFMLSSALDNVKTKRHRRKTSIVPRGRGSDSTLEGMSPKRKRQFNYHDINVQLFHEDIKDQMYHHWEKLKIIFDIFATENCMEILESNEKNINQKRGNGLHFHPLKGNLRVWHSVDLDKNKRFVFRINSFYEDNSAKNLSILSVDGHYPKEYTVNSSLFWRQCPSLDWILFENSARDSRYIKARISLVMPKLEFY